MDKIYQNLVWVAKQHHQQVSPAKRVVLVARVTSRRSRKTHAPSRDMVTVLESEPEKALQDCTKYCINKVSQSLMAKHAPVLVVRPDEW